MKKSFINVLLFFVVGIYSTVLAQFSGNYNEGLKYIDKNDIKKSITYLASDEMKGRAAGTPENLEAAKFIAKKFFDFGLKPYNDIANPPLFRTKKNTSIEAPKVFTPEKYFQRFNITESKLNQKECALTLIKNNSSKEYAYDYQKDYLIDYNSNKNLSLNAPLVFVGYGIEKDANGYNDFIDEDGKEIDVKNKIALVIDSYPQENDTASFFSKARSTKIKSIKQKVLQLKEKGALAVLAVQSPIKNQSPFVVKMENLAKAFSRTDFDLPELNTAETIPLIYISKDVLADIMAGSGKTMTDILKKIDQDLKARSFAFNDIGFNVKIKYDSRLLETQNVIGVLEGTDPVLKNEYVVVGGHFDHVGLGFYGAMSKANAGQIHNGADDNASGTSGMIELAEAFSNVKPKRSMIFIGFTGEENGLLGSRHYAYQNPLYSLEKTVAMVNLDMISRNDNRILWVGGIFYSSDMKKVVEEANQSIGFELLYNVGLYTFASDQGPFIRRNIPSIFFFAGDHEDYHTPGDDADKVDFEKAEKVSKLAYLTTWLLTNVETKPAYRALTNDEKAGLVKESLERQKKYKLDKKTDDSIQ